MNATINILCFESKTLAKGEHPLMICICKDSKRRYICLGVSVAPQYWDFQKNKPKRNRLHKVITKVNDALKEIGKELGIPIDLTTHVSPSLVCHICLFGQWGKH